MNTVIAIACALTAAVCLNYAMFLQKKAVEGLPPVKFEISWSTTKAFATNIPWLLAVGLSVVGGGFYAIAIMLAPISIVQPIVGSGVALLAYLAMKHLGEKPRRIDLLAIGMSILGVILIGVSVAEGLPEEVKHDPVELWIFTGAILVLATVVALVMRRGGGSREAAGLGIAVGILFGCAAIFARLLLLDWAHRWPDQKMAVLFASIFLIAWAFCLIPGFITLQAALQRGMAVVVVPLVAGLAQVIPILGGMIALNEPLPDNGFLAAVRIIAFLLIVVAVVILSRRAEEAPEDVSGEADQPVSA